MQGKLEGSSFQQGPHQPQHNLKRARFNHRRRFNGLKAPKGRHYMDIRIAYLHFIENGKTAFFGRTTSQNHYRSRTMAQSYLLQSLRTAIDSVKEVQQRLASFVKKSSSSDKRTR